jgi:hypothetical protein
VGVNQSRDKVCRDGVGGRFATTTPLCRGSVHSPEGLGTNASRVPSHAGAAFPCFENNFYIRILYLIHFRKFFKNSKGAFESVVCVLL